MGLPSSRFLLFHRLIFLPPLMLITVACLYTSSTLSGRFSSTRRFSFSQDAQCFSCDSSGSSSSSRSFLPLANFPDSSYIGDVILRQNVLNVEDSSGETTTHEPASRRDTNHDVESIDYGEKSSEEAGPDEVVVEVVSHRSITRSVQEKDHEKPAEENKVTDGSMIYGDNNNVAPTEEKIIVNSAALSAENNLVDNSVPSDSTVVESAVPGDENIVDSSVTQVVEISSETTPANLEESRKEDHVDSSVPDGENAHSSGEVEEFSSESQENEKFSSESKESLESYSTRTPTRTEDVDRSVPEDKIVGNSVQAEETSYSGTIQDISESNRKEDDHGSVPEDVDGSSLKVVEFTTETKENFEGDRKEDLQLENRHLTSDDQSSPDKHVEAPPETIHMSVTESVPAPPPQATEIEVMRSGHANMSKEVGSTRESTIIAVQNKVDAITKSGLPKEILNSPNAVDLDVNLLLRGGSPQGVPLREEKSCEGRHIFVYNLPSKFNVDLVGQCDKLLHWLNFCEYFMNGGMGTNVPTDELNDRGEKVLVPDGSWFLTHQYALELIFHARLKHYPCLTTDVNRADLFFVPYYAGLDVIRWHFKANTTNDQRDELTVELMNWLEGQETWSRNNGIDHVFVLGKISWDFRRSSNKAHWGSKLLVLPEMVRTTKLLIERDPWDANDIGVPHPTFFHPKDDNEIRTWLAHVEQSERRYLVSFAGMPRPNMKTNVRGHLIQQCLDNPDDCFLLRCVRTLCMRPDSTMNLFLHSHFCMQPPGDSPTRRSVFDSLVGGCIPVLFDPYTAYYQYPWHLPRNASSYSVFIPSSEVMEGKADIVEILKSISPEERTAMRTRIIREIIPGLLYSQPGTKHSDFRDSFDISIEAVLHRVANVRAGQKSM